MNNADGWNRSALGALGVLFGQRLMANGADVRVIADEARAERYQKQGVTCNGAPVSVSIRDTPKKRQSPSI